MIEFGVLMPQETVNYDSLKRIALLCEKQGFDSIWLYDHLYPFWKGKTAPILECWTTLSALSSSTKKLKLGTLVLNNLIRHPSILAKMGATLDVISGGRLELGIGAGDPSTKQECIDFGIKFPKADERICRLREAVYIIKRMWTNDYCNYEGKYYSIRNASCTPKPLQKPHPRILIGGIGDKVLRVVAEQADACNFWELSPEEYKQRLAVLKQYCLSYGRNYQKITKSWGGEILVTEKERDLRLKIEQFKPIDRSIDEFQKRCIVGTPPQCYEKINMYIDLGVTYFIFSFLDAESLRVFSREILSILRRQY